MVSNLFAVYTRLGAGWASSLLGFIAAALLPVPWLIFTTGKRLRAMSKFPTSTGIPNIVAVRQS